MFSVKADKDESASSLVSRFIKKQKKSELFDILRERQYFKKPSVKKREKKQQRARVMKGLKQEQQHETE